MNATVAIPYSESDGSVFPHFGKSACFKIYVVEDDRVVSSEVAATDGAGHEELGLWLVQHGVSAVLCDGIGPGALGALAAAGVVALAGVSGAADQAVEDLIAGRLAAVQTPICGCSGHHGGCGSHGCGAHHGCGGAHGGCGAHHGCGGCV